MSTLLAPQAVMCLSAADACVQGSAEVLAAAGNQLANQTALAQEHWG